MIAEACPGHSEISNDISVSWHRNITIWRSGRDAPPWSIGGQLWSDGSHPYPVPRENPDFCNFIPDTAAPRPRKVGLPADHTIGSQAGTWRHRDLIPETFSLFVLTRRGLGHEAPGIGASGRRTQLGVCTDASVALVAGASRPRGELIADRSRQAPAGSRTSRPSCSSTPAARPVEWQLRSPPPPPFAFPPLWWYPPPQTTGAPR